MKNPNALLEKQIAYPESLMTRPIESAPIPEAAPGPEPWIAGMPPGFLSSEPEAAESPADDLELRAALALCLNSFGAREALASLAARGGAAAGVAVAEDSNSQLIVDRRSQSARRGHQRRYCIEAIEDNHRFGGERRARIDRRQTQEPGPWPGD